MKRLSFAKSFRISVFVCIGFCCLALFSADFKPAPARKMVFTYHEPHIEVNLNYEVEKDTLETPFLTPNVPFTRLKKLRAERRDESLPPLLQKSFACSKSNRIAVSTHETCYNFRDFMKLIDLNIKPVTDTAMIYTSRYVFRTVLTKVQKFHDNPNYTYYEYKFFNRADRKLMYIVGYVHQLGFVYVKSKTQLEDGRSELREWQLEKINGIPVKSFLWSEDAAKFQYFNVL